MHLSITLIFIIVFLPIKNIVAEEDADALPVMSHYLSLDPAFVVNVTDGSRVQHMQVSLQVKYTKAETEHFIQIHTPAIRHELVMLLSGQPVTNLKTSTGKQALMAEALLAIQKVLIDNTQEAGVEAVYFTDLVIQ